MRYFRIYSDEVYENFRAEIDSKLGYPTPDGITITSIEPAITAPRDTNGKVLLAMHSDFCHLEFVSIILSNSLLMGTIEEINRESYIISISRPII